MATTLPQPEIALGSRMPVICQKLISDNPTFPKNHRFYDVDQLIVFVGMVFLPYLQVERDNNPLSVLELRKRSGYTDSSEVELSSNGNIMLNYHCDTRFHLDFKAHLMNICKSVLDLSTRGPINHDANPNPVQVPNLELQLVLIDWVLESKVKGARNKKRKLKTCTGSESD
ncbi:uncharacterized protein EAF01_001925 [Botrytis porri]|uniref:uncharacterized protein n=1 Tax=Botrytis porri TaxID=87229 RepID=UPI001900C5B0|nr:uncharacterized protein EAF01_001925 [Botrytis porri]KAF7912904.1 hypothetical protein EAF01_001925 [Botrytis porri]